MLALPAGVQKVSKAGLKSKEKCTPCSVRFQSVMGWMYTPVPLKMC